VPPEFFCLRLSVSHFLPCTFSISLFALSFLPWDYFSPTAFDVRLSASCFLPWDVCLILFTLDFSSSGFSPRAFSLVLFALSFLPWDFFSPMAFDVRLSASCFLLQDVCLMLLTLDFSSSGFSPRAFSLVLFA
jgi:hypothetical protein